MMIVYKVFLAMVISRFTRIYYFNSLDGARSIVSFYSLYFNVANMMLIKSYFKDKNVMEDITIFPLEYL